jgi:hypothetical protein
LKVLLECQSVPEAGWAGRKNGLLLLLAEGAGFDLFFTIDKGLQYQQNLAGRGIAVLIVHARSNRLQDLLPHLDACRSIMSSIQPGEVIRLG